MPNDLEARREVILRLFVNGGGKTAAEVGLALQRAARKQSLLGTGVGPTQFEVLHLAATGLLRSHNRVSARGTELEYLITSLGMEFLQGRAGELELSSPPDGNEPFQACLDLPPPPA